MYKYFFNKIEHIGSLVCDFDLAWQLLTATRAEIYCHIKFATVADKITFKASWA